MQINGTIEQMSGLLSRSYQDKNGGMQTVEYLTMVINNGLERIACETNSTSQARSLLAEGLKKHDRVQAVLLTWCHPRKTQDGREFFSNDTRIVALHRDYMPDDDSAGASGYNGY